jgi:hypothetical protein
MLQTTSSAQHLKIYKYMNTTVLLKVLFVASTAYSFCKDLDVVRY